GHVGEAVAADVEIAEREPAPLVLRPAADLLLCGVQPAEVEIAPHAPLEAVDEGGILGEVDRAEIAHAPVLRIFSRGAGGREPSGYWNSTRAERSRNSCMLSANRYILSCPSGSSYRTCRTSPKCVSVFRLCAVSAAPSRWMLSSMSRHAANDP